MHCLLPAPLHCLWHSSWLLQPVPAAMLSLPRLLAQSWLVLTPVAAAMVRWPRLPAQARLVLTPAAAMQVPWLEHQLVQLQEARLLAPLPARAPKGPPQHSVSQQALPLPVAMAAAEAALLSEAATAWGHPSVTRLLQVVHPSLPRPWQVLPQWLPATPQVEAGPRPAPRCLLEVLLAIRTA